MGVILRLPEAVALTAITVYGVTMFGKDRISMNFFYALFDELEYATVCYNYNLEME